MNRKLTQKGLRRPDPEGPRPLADAVKINTGLTPDLLSIILVVAIQAKGEVVVHQKMFESRLFFVDKLQEYVARDLTDAFRPFADVIGRQPTDHPRN